MAAIMTMQELCRLNIHVYNITGLKASYDSSGNEILGADVPAYLKGTERDYQQIIEISIEEERDDRGALTGCAESFGLLTQNRTSLFVPERVLIFRRDNDGGQWCGWPGLRDGTFNSPDDTVGTPQTTE